MCCGVRGSGLQGSRQHRWRYSTILREGWRDVRREVLVEELFNKIEGHTEAWLDLELLECTILEPLLATEHTRGRECEACTC